jgi:hypothetical protein
MEPSSSSSTSSSARSGVPEARRHYPKLSSGKQRRLRRDGVVTKSGSTSSVQPNCRSLALETVGRGSTELKAVTSPTEDLTLRTSSEMDLPSRGWCSGHRPSRDAWRLLFPVRSTHLTPRTSHWKGGELLRGESTHHQPVEERRGFFLR